MNKSISLLTLFILNSFLAITLCHGTNSVNNIDDKTFSIYDHGLNMKIATYNLPTGWRIDHRIITATNDYTRFFKSYKFDFHGNKKEVIRNFEPVKFCPAIGESLPKTWHRTMVQQLEPFGKFAGGELTQTSWGRYIFPQFENVPGLQLVESFVTGYRNGQAFEGVCIGFLAYGEYASLFNGVIILSPKGQLQATADKYIRMNNSKRDNPQYTRKIQQLNQQKNNQYVNYAQQIMRSRKQQFDAWQRAHKSAVDAYSSSNAAFNKYLKGGSSGSSSNGPYTPQDGFNDSVQGVTSFDDAYLGYRVKKNGFYDYWYTDGFGNYHGTNDPGFDPSTLGSNWKRAYPVQN